MRSRRIVFAARPLVLALSAAAALASGCSRATKPIVPVTPLRKVVITPHADTLVAGAHVQLVAVAYDTSGAADPNIAAAWSSANPAIASVNSNGLVTAVSEGVAKIMAFAGDKSDTARVYVTSATTGWVVQTSATIHDLYGVWFQPDGRSGVAVGDAGTVLTTSDAGATWHVGTGGTSADLKSVCFTSADTGWASGAGGALMKTVNGGVTWARQTNLATSADLMRVRFADSRHGWVVGSGGLIARTADGGASWTTQFPVAWNLHSVSFTDSLNGWLAGANGTVMGSHDGGISWYAVPLGVASQTLNAIMRFDDTTAVAAGTQGTIARTSATPDSIAWSTSSVGASDALNGVFLIDAMTGWAVGANPNGAILRTDDGGQSWTPQTAGVAQVLRDVYFVDPLRGWVVGSGGRILHTSHGGNP
jgi:photosystem II stability/assembly factor-like uncharacterized protein